MEGKKPPFSAATHPVLKILRRVEPKSGAIRLFAKQSKGSFVFVSSPITTTGLSSEHQARRWVSCLFKSRPREISPPEKHQKPPESSSDSGKATIRSRSFKRVVSWSHYVEAVGVEQAVETARDWMIDMSQLFLGHRFATGTYSRLYHGFYKQKAVAVKVIRAPEEDEALSSRLDKQFSLEVALLSRLHHANIVEFVAACKKPPVLCVVTEYLPGGSLKTFLHESEPGSLPLELVARIALDVARGMEYLHSQGVIHRDLKSDNLIMTDDLHIKVVDFGVSCLESERHSMKGFVGTYRWMAPEMIKEKPCSRKVDVYSFGIVLWELLTGLTPFAGMTPVQVAFAVSQKNARPAVPAHCPAELGRLMQKCWSRNPVRRPEFNQVVKILEKFETWLRQETNESSVNNSFQYASAFRCCIGVPYTSD